MGFEGVPDVPFSVVLGNVLEQSDVVGQSEESDKLQPSARQYALQPGDFCLLASSDSEVDSTLMICEVLNPEEYTQEFPDYGDRLHNGYILCKWTDQGSPPMEGVGWFSRVKMIQVTEEQYATVLGWFTDEQLPDEPPEWITQAFKEYTDEMHALSPEEIPKMVTCGKCGSAKVTLRLQHQVKYAAPAGEIMKDGKIRFIPFGDGESKCESSGHLYCTECRSTKEIEKGELLISNKAEMLKILGHSHLT